MLNLSDDRTFRPLQRYEQIAERLAGDIRSGLLAAGERLPSERDLARSLEVSRASVREAIGALQVQGIVETRPDAAPPAAGGSAPPGPGERGSRGRAPARSSPRMPPRTRPCRTTPARPPYSR